METEKTTVAEFDHATTETHTVVDVDEYGGLHVTVSGEEDGTAISPDRAEKIATAILRCRPNLTAASDFGTLFGGGEDDTDGNTSEGNE